MEVPRIESQEPERRTLTPEEIQREQRLKQRAQQRWDAIIDRDFSKAYEYETPKFRAENSPKEYRAKYGGPVTHHVATVKDVRYDAPHEAVVKIMLEASFPLGGEQVRTTVPVYDRWTYLEGEWWRLDIDRPLGAPSNPQPSPTE
jgi:hypothetical protein